jgi:hypothetical protein
MTAAVQRSAIYVLILKYTIGIGFDSRELTNLAVAKILMCPPGRTVTGKSNTRKGLPDCVTMVFAVLHCCCVLSMSLDEHGAHLLRKAEMGQSMED